MPRLPSLDLIRGFEAAARLASFTRAAQEISVTQSAISRQVQALEEQLGVALFERHHRAIRLTEAGRVFQRAATEALQLIANAAAQVRHDSLTPSLTITCTFGFASLWLVPRLMDFRDRHPGIEIRVAANNKYVDLERERVELAVRYCDAVDAPPDSVKLFSEEVFPVCSPALLAQPGRPLRTAADLQGQVLLHHDEAESHWPTGSWIVWLETRQLPSLRPAGSLRFNQYDQLIQAAIDGQGVALGIGPLVKRHLEQGRLVAPFRERTTTLRAYFLVTADFAASADKRPEVAAFRSWLIAAAAR